MIIEGKNGSVNFYWKDIFLTSFPLGNVDYDFYKKQAEDMILNAMREGKKISQMIPVCQNYCNLFYHRRHVKKERVRDEDHQFFAVCVLCLIRLEIIDFDDHILIMNKKKKSKVNIKWRR
tara:strand:+ start:1741 stop:2100 length:360 start_codon:yes stop_codon:yes gene_type:complete